MRHSSVRVPGSVELLHIEPVTDLISKCEIKVCYVSDKPNRNRSVITKTVATKMANSLPGNPIVGFYNEDRKDFEEHNRELKIDDNGDIKFIDVTRPYGFVDLNPKVWFEKFVDDEQIEREYLMTEGWLWTSQYPACKRVVEKGNNQSMELNKNLDAKWAKNEKGQPEFFIINEAMIEKLCILGDDEEPCFEGSQINPAPKTFSLDDSFKTQLFSMMNELKELLNKGGEKVLSVYSMKIGDQSWDALFNHVATNYADYTIEQVLENEGKVYSVLKDSEGKFYRLDCEFDTENNTYSFGNELSDISDSYASPEEPQFNADEVAEYAKKKKEEEEKAGGSEEKPKDGEEKPEDKNKEKTSENEDKSGEKKSSEPDNKTEDKCPKCGKPKSQCTCGDDEDEKKKKKKYSLEGIPEFAQLTAEFEELQTKFSALENENNELKAQLTPLVEFKQAAEKQEKQKMIDSFYMLNDEDKEDVIANIDTYSLEDIEAKLSVICVRNKVSFHEDSDDDKKDPIVFHLDGAGDDDSGLPDWVKAALATQKNLD